MKAHSQILVGVTGSIAAIKAPQVVRLLVEQGHQVRVVMTKSAEQFVSPLVLSTFSKEPVISGLFGENAYQVPHIRWTEEADLMLVMAVSATVLARFAHGLAEDMVSLCYLSMKGPVVMAPAMHDSMWEHPAVQENVKILKDRGVHFIEPFTGRLADGTTGLGRMPEPDAIVKAVVKILGDR